MTLICLADETAGERREGCSPGAWSLSAFLESYGDVHAACWEVPSRVVSLKGAHTHAFQGPGAGRGLPGCWCLGMSQAADEICSLIPPSATSNFFTLGSTIQFRHLVFCSFSQASCVCWGGLAWARMVQKPSLAAAQCSHSPQAVTASWPTLPATAALGFHRFITSLKCGGCRQQVSWRSTGAAAFGSDLGLRKPTEWGNSEGLLSSLFHLWPPTFWAKKAGSGQAGVKQNCLKSKKMVVNMMGRGGWESPHLSQFSGLSTHMPGMGLCQHLLPFCLLGLASVFHLNMIVFPEPCKGLTHLLLPQTLWF